ncbi:MAG: acyltransferase [Acidobacteriota bacterium]|nr:acyltransferase [Acidobacteriota bacterium]
MAVVAQAFRRASGDVTSASRRRPPTAVSGRHLPALDGLRALAILGVLAYHLNLGWASGGFLGVDLFFVLSGFLITSLLLEEAASKGRIRLGQFWARRGRRLLPALFLLLVAISLFAVVNGRFLTPGSGGAVIDLGSLRGDALATLFYFANWHAVFAHQSYFAQYSTPSPLEHTWSLAIEEQFYLLWPLLIALVVKVRRRWRTGGVLLCLGGIVASALEMAFLFHAGQDPSRVYFGTDTRAFDLLAGASVAFLAAARPQPGPRARRWLHAVSIPAALLLGVFWVVGGTSGGLPRNELFTGGFVACAALAAVVIADVRQFDRGLLGRLLSLGPLRWLGRVSYGVYLWHWPVFVYLTPTSIGVAGAGLDVLRVATTILLAAGSYYLLELPVRRRRRGPRTLALLGPVTLGVTALVIVGATTPSIAQPALAGPVRGWAQALNPEVGSTVVGAGGYQGEIPIRLPAGTVVSPSHPLRVVTFGDSIMTTTQYALDAALRSTHDVVSGNAAIPGWSLEPSKIAALMGFVETFRPQILVGTWVGNAALARTDPNGYRALLDESIGTLLAPSTGVAGIVLLQLPALGPVPAYLSATGASRHSWDARLEGVPAWNAAAAAAARRWPGRVMYLPVAPSLEHQGAFTSWLPPHDLWTAPVHEWVRVRTIDNIHVCPAGITRYSAPVLSDMISIFHLAPSTGAWWRDRVIRFNLYESPGGIAYNCPGDHPPG